MGNVQILIAPPGKLQFIYRENSKYTPKNFLNHENAPEFLIIPKLHCLFSLLVQECTRNIVQCQNSCSVALSTLSTIEFSIFHPPPSFINFLHSSRHSFKPSRSLLHNYDNCFNTSVYLERYRKAQSCMSFICLLNRLRIFYQILRCLSLCYLLQRQIIRR